MSITRPSTSNVEVSSPKSSSVTNMKLLQLAINGPKSARGEALIQKLIREHNTIAEREELRKRLAPNIGSVVQESVASEVLRLLTEADANAAIEAERVFFADLHASSADSTSPAAKPSTVSGISRIKLDPTADNVDSISKIVIKQERITPPPPSVDVLPEDPEPVNPAAQEPPNYKPLRPVEPAMAKNFDYLTASNRLLELTIESEEIKGQLQVLDRQIAKCLEMRMNLLNRQQSMDAERLALVSVSKPPSPSGLVQQQQQQQQQQQHQHPNLQNTDAMSSSSIDYSALDKYSLPSTTKRKLAATKPRVRKKAGVKSTPKKKSNAATKVAAKKKNSGDTKVTAENKKVTLKKPTEEPKEVAVASSTVTSKVSVEADLVTEPVDNVPFTQAKSLAADHTLTLPTPANKIPDPSIGIQENNEVLDSRPVSPTNKDSYAPILKPSNVFQIDVPRATFRLPPQSSCLSTTNDTTIPSLLSNFSFKPQPSTPTITSEQVTKAPATSSTIFRPRRQHEASDKLECDNMKRKAPAAPSQDESAGDKKPRVVQRPTDLICLEGKPRRVLFYGHRKAVTILKVHGDNVFSSSLDGSIKRYSPLTDSERLMYGRPQLGYNYEYIHNSRDVCGLELFVTKQATYIIVGIRDGTLKKFIFDSKWPLLTVSVKAVVTCIALRWNTLFVGTVAGKVLRFSAMKFQFESTLPCADHPITCLGTAMEGACRILIAGSHGGDVNIRDALSGLFNRWLKLRPNRYPIGLMVVQDRVYTRAAVRDANYEIYVHNVENGNLLHLIEGTNGISSFFVSVTDPDSVYFTTKNSFVYKYSCDGGLPVKLECGLNAGEPSALCLHKNMIIVGSHNGELQALFYEVK